MKTYSKRRGYEISLWTLQDGFIAVLGDSSSQTRGYIENPSMQLSNDGTQELDFSLPMYIDDGITRKKNNIWAYMTDAVTIAGMRKIKVIFNKGTDVEKIYEFIITKVTDTHESNKPMCEVHCEGLAFHELGKLGYKISLSMEDFEADEEAEWDRLASEWTAGEQQVEFGMQPSIDYWCEKVGLTKYVEGGLMNASTWYYKVEMDWSGFEHGYMRNKDVIYEEAYISSYDEHLDAASYTEHQEKLRFVTSSGSNIYNLTQDIAKTFGVYCKYEYIHDENYHIIGRVVIFYNNFFDEQNRLEFTYPYTTSRVTRENDCTDLVTKMYVNAIESDTSDTGMVTIMDNPVNPTGEDYLLNFDYLYAIGTITDEQYAYIKEFSIAMREINKHIVNYQNQSIKRETVEVTYSAQLAVLESAMAEDNKQIESYQDQIADLTGNTGKITREGVNCKLLGISNHKIVFNEGGIIPSTVKLYDADTTPTSSSETIPCTITINSSGYAASATIADSYTKTTIKAGYDYHPQEYYEKVIELYTNRLKRDTEQYNKLEALIETITNEIAQAQENLETLLEQKNKLLQEFQETMGPALREGNWTPEDYTNVAHASYQFINKITTGVITGNTTSSTYEIAHNPRGPVAKLIWDCDLLYNEQDVKYKNLSEQYSYYYILTLDVDDMAEISKFYANQKNANKPYGLVFWDTSYSYSDNAINRYPSPVVKSFIFSSNCECVFLKITNNNVTTITPAILLTDLDATTLENLCAEENSSVNLYLGTVGINNSNHITISKRCTGNDTSTCYAISKDRIALANSYTELCELRFQIQDYTLLIDEQNLKVKYGSNEFLEPDDYQVTQIIHTSSMADDNGYQITFKPMSLFKLWNVNNKLQINYNCSQLSTAIYLDAVEILKENAYPKVTYTIDPNLIYEDFFYTDYNSLNKIAFINDNELEFNEVQGYISGITLNLDKPWEDSIEVKNYKNKFEDIFSTIVASSDTMQKNEAFISSVGNVVNVNGTLSQEQLQSALSSTTLKYTMSNGMLSIGKANGILTNNGDGAISFRPNAIVYASTTSDTGEWVWRDALTPQGINAAAITYGNLNIVNANLGNGAVIVKDKSFTLASEKLNLNSEDCTFNLNGTKVAFNSEAGTFKFICDVLTLNSEQGLISENINNNVINGNITLANGILSSNSINNDTSSLGVKLQNGILSINTKNNLYINGSDIETYIKNNSDSQINNWWSNRTIDISRVSIGIGDVNRSVYVTNNSVRLGSVNSIVFEYQKEITPLISTLSLGNIFNYSNSNSVETASLGSWSITSSENLVTKDQDNNIISQISPNDFKINDYIRTQTDSSDNHSVRIKRLYLDKGDNDNYHTITFRNSDGNNDFKLQVRPSTSEHSDPGLFLDFGDGTGYHRVALVDALDSYLNG